LAWNFVTSVGNSGGVGVWGSVVIDSKLNSVYFGTGNPNILVNNATSDIRYSYSMISLDATTGALNWVYTAHLTAGTRRDNDLGSTPNRFNLTIGGNTVCAVGLGRIACSY